MLFADAQLDHADLAHAELLDLAADGHREVVDELDVPRRLEVGNAALAELAQRLGLDLMAGCSLTQATISSPNLLSGTPITCTSATAGWVKRNSSISRGYTFSPPRMIMSLLRPTILM